MHDIDNEFFSVGEMMDSVASVQRAIGTALSALRQAKPSMFEEEDEDNEYLTVEQAPYAHSYSTLEEFSNFLPEMAATVISVALAARETIDLDSINDVYYDDPENE